MRYFIDLDETLCRNLDGNNYEMCEPIVERIEKVNRLFDEGHYIVIWTARGKRSGKDWSEKTLEQLKEWNVKYNELNMDKPDYDVYIDDKSFNVDSIWRVPPKTNKYTKKETPEIVKKGWGKEIIFANEKEYCGKILHYDAGKKSSLHYHVKKRETWYVAKGRFILTWIISETGEHVVEYLNVGDVITNLQGEAHQVEALEEGDLFEVSTEHFDSDSRRIHMGD